MSEQQGTHRSGLAVFLGSDGDVSIQEQALPAPCADQVLVKVAAAGCNRADLLQRAGRYPAPPGAPQNIPGLEFSGVVTETGSAVLSLREGERVMGIAAGGAQAEYLLIPEQLCVPVPASIDLVEAGALPEAFFTAFEALVGQGAIRTGASVLVNAVGSGVGTAVIQLANALGASVVGTTRTPEKLKRCRELGLAAGVVITGDEEPETAVERIKGAAGGELDLAVDLLGGTHLSIALDALRVGGTAVSLGFISAPQVSVSLTALVARRQRLVGTSLRSRPTYEKAALASRFTDEVLPLVASGGVRPVVDRLFPLSDAAKAYDALASNTTFGKLLLTMDQHV